MSFDFDTAPIPGTTLIRANGKSGGGVASSSTATAAAAAAAAATTINHNSNHHHRSITSIKNNNNNTTNNNTNTNASTTNNNNNNKRWRLKSKRGSSLDYELSSIARSIDDDDEDGDDNEHAHLREHDIDDKNYPQLRHDNELFSFVRPATTGIDEENDFGRPQSSLSENGIFGTVEEEYQLSSRNIDHAYRKSNAAATGGIAANHSSNFHFSSDEIRRFANADDNHNNNNNHNHIHNNIDYFDSTAAAAGASSALISAGSGNDFRSASSCGNNGGGRSTRATTPGCDEQIFQESIESLQVRIGRLLSSEEMCDMHFIVTSSSGGGGGLGGTLPKPHPPNPQPQPHPHPPPPSAATIIDAIQKSISADNRQYLYGNPDNNTDNNAFATTKNNNQQSTWSPSQPQQPLRKLRIPAHRLVMITASPVFKQMLYDAQTNTMFSAGGGGGGGEDIEISDIDAAAFLEFLRYAYTDSARLTKDNVVGVRLAASRYQIPSLERQCIDYVQRCLARKSCLAIWLSARAYGDPELERVARKSVQHFADAALLSNDFLRADFRAVCDLLSDDLLRADEITVFRALTRWGKQACRRAALCPTRANVRAAIGGALHLVRFPLMSEEQVQRVVASEGIIEDELIRALLHYARHWPKVGSVASVFAPITTVNGCANASGPAGQSGTGPSFGTGSFPFPAEPRTYQRINQSEAELKQVYRFASFESTLPNRYVNRSLNFITNKRIWLVGVGLYSPRKACTFYLNVWVRVRRADSFGGPSGFADLASTPTASVSQPRWISPLDRAEQTVMMKYDGSGTILQVRFDEPLQVEANVSYEVAACVTPTTKSTSLVRARLHPHLYYTRPADVNFYYGTEGQYATKVRVSAQQNVIFNFNWEKDVGVANGGGGGGDDTRTRDSASSDTVSNQNFCLVSTQPGTTASEPTTPNVPPPPPPPPRPPPPQEYRRPSRMQRLRRALSFVDRREDAMHAARESGLLEGQIPVLYFFA